MPVHTFSVIVPVHNVRAYLRECLDSVLGQSFRDFELIAVDDASPDGSGEILDEYAARDERVRVLHLAENVGLGPARDAGIDVATGDYLLFVDSDDTMTEGSLEALAARLEATGRPDVLIFDYARTYWDGEVVRNDRADLLRAPGPDVFRIDDRPELLNLLMIVWNKAYRRDFVARHGFRFPPGYYEDLPWTYPTLLAAERIALLDRVCVHYRQRRHGSILVSRSRKHFDVFAQYDRIFAFLDAHPELERWRATLFTRMIDHCWVILAKPNRVPRADQQEFFRRTTEIYRRRLPEGYRPPQDRSGTRMRAVARGDLRAFLLLRSASRTRSLLGAAAGSGRRRTAEAADLARRAAVRAYYQAALRQPVEDDLAVYAAYWFRGYACNPAAIYEEARRLAPHIRGVWVVQEELAETMPPGVDYVLLGSREYYSVMARAKYLVNNVNFPDNIVKRPGTVHLQTHHGTPLKKMGLDLRDYPVGADDIDFDKLMRRCDRWDYVLSANRFSAEVWERSFPSDYTSLESGYPRNDRLVRATVPEVEQVRAALGIEPGTTVVLYAPTFRDWARHGFEPQVDLADLAERLGDGHLILVRGHYWVPRADGIDQLDGRGRVRDVSGHPVMEDLLLAADVLLTDYSSVMFDYANLDRPIVVHANDWDTYVRTRGVNFDLLAMPPGVVTTTQDELVDAFRSGRFRDEDSARARKEFRRKFCEYDDGHAAERVVRRVFLDEPLLGRRSGEARETPHDLVADDEDAGDDI